MPWSGGSFTRSNGVHNGPTTWGQDQAAGTGIVSTVHDTHDQDLATGINACWNRDGSNSPTANMAMGGFKFTGLGIGSSSGDSVNYSQMNAAIAAAVAALIPSATSMLFYQASAPTGWTQNTSKDDCLIRVVSGTGGGSYTSGTGFSTVNAAGVSGTVGGTSITKAQLPLYNLDITDPGHSHTYSTIAIGTTIAGGNNISPTGNPAATSSNTTGITVSSGGSGNAHTHSFTGNAPNINYISAIICTKN